MAGAGGGFGRPDSFDDDDYYDADEDRIRRHYLQHQRPNSERAQTSTMIGQDSSQQPPETIHVKLNESYFAREQRALIDLVANIRQKFQSTQLFNPAKNQSIREQQQQWTEDVSIALPRAKFIARSARFHNSSWRELGSLV